MDVNSDNDTRLVINNKKVILLRLVHLEIIHVLHGNNQLKLNGKTISLINKHGTHLNNSPL